MIVLLVLLCIMLARGFSIISSGQFQVVLLLWVMAVMALLVLEERWKRHTQEEASSHETNESPS